MKGIYFHSDINENSGDAETPKIIIISKEGLNDKSAKAPNLNILTLKEGELTLRMKMKNDCNSNLSHERIIKTVSNIKHNLSKKDSFVFDNNRNQIINNIKLQKNEKDKEITVIKECKDISSVFVANNDKISENEEILAFSCKNSVKKTLGGGNRKDKDKTKSLQQSDIAEISKVNSESDNITDFDNKTKILVKYVQDSKIINGDINENEEIENNCSDQEKGSKISISNKNKVNSKCNYKDNIKNNIDNKIIIENEEYNDEKLIENENNQNVSEQKKFIPNFQKNSNIINIIDKKENIQKQNNINIFNKINKNKEDESNLLDLFRIKTPRTIPQEHCFICNRLLFITKLFTPSCNLHHLCRKCAKNYYEGEFEDNNTSLKCPQVKCEGKINYEILKNIISEGHRKIYERNNNNNDINHNNDDEDKIDKNIEMKDKLIPGNKDTTRNKFLYFDFKDKSENLKLYSQKHVIDINSNENFFMYNKSKDIYCPSCYMPSLFTKTNTHFIKCLNCSYKICKYCLKEYNDKHLDIKLEEHCKVYYRREADYSNDRNCFIKYLLQLFFVFAMFYLSFIGIFFTVLKIFKVLFFFNGERNIGYYTKMVFIIFLSLVCSIICYPVIFIFHPFFPYIVSLFDY